MFEYLIRLDTSQLLDFFFKKKSSCRYKPSIKLWQVDKLLKTGERVIVFIIKVSQFY